VTQNDAHVLQESSKFLWNSKIARVVVNVQHRFEDGYEPSDLDSLHLEFRQLLSTPEGRKKYREVGSLWIDTCTCGLRLELAGQIAVACGDSTEKVLARFKQLVGKMLVRVNVTSPGGDTEFVFEDGMIFRCFSATSHARLSWRLSTADQLA
jgi:hypothetical protein